MAHCQYTTGAFKQIPDELLLQICGYLAMNDLKALRLVDKKMSRLAATYLFESKSFTRLVVGDLAILHPEMVDHRRSSMIQPLPEVFSEIGVLQHVKVATLRADLSTFVPFHRRLMELVARSAGVANHHRFNQLPKLNTVRVVLPEEGVCIALLFPSQQDIVSLLDLVFDYMQTNQLLDPDFTPVRTLVLEGAEQSLLPRLQLPQGFNITSLCLSGVAFCDDDNLKVVLDKRVRKLSMVDCYIVVRITTVLPKIKCQRYIRQVSENPSRYDIDLRWSDIFAVVAASSVKDFSFGDTQYLNGMGEVVEGIDSDGHERYRAYEHSKITSCPPDLATFDTTFKDAIALMNLQRIKGCFDKADEILFDFGRFPRFVELAAAGMRTARLASG